jgi:hypothetical protein
MMNEGGEKHFRNEGFVLSATMMNQLCRALLALLVLLVSSTACMEVNDSPAAPTPDQGRQAPAQAAATPQGVEQNADMLVPRVTVTPTAEEASNGTVFNRIKEILEHDGARVEIGQRVEQDYIRSATRIIEVEGEKVLVFALPNERAAQTASRDIAEDGRSIGGQDLDLRRTPWYFIEERFILLTVSEDEDLLELFQEALGEPFAGGEPLLQRPPDFVIETAEDVYHALLYEGAHVEVGSNLQAPLETEEAFYLLVEGEQVQLYQMSTRAEAERVARAISEDGTSIGFFPVPAEDTPHFFLEGRVIGFYQGENREILELLVEVLGEPVTENY